MRDKVVKYIEEYNMINEGDRIVLGVSGGADSMALFEVLLNMRESYKLSLYVVHINHGIRKEAGDDALFVQKNV
jgi:tRNA(Ile)-lysidine synthase